MEQNQIMQFKNGQRSGGDSPEDSQVANRYKEGLK